jgi:hypothetical protein
VQFQSVQITSYQHRRRQLLSQVSKNIECLAVGQHDVHDDQLEIPRKRRARLALQCVPQNKKQVLRDQEA